MVAATSTPTSVWYTIRATGVVALVLLTVTMVLGLLTAGRVRTRRWPAFAQADLHKRVTLLAMVFLALHVLTAVLDTYVHVGSGRRWSCRSRRPIEPLWTGLGAVAVDLMVAVAVSSALRQRISPRTWRGIHWLAYGCWPLAMAHALGEGTDAVASCGWTPSPGLQHRPSSRPWPGGSATTGRPAGRPPGWAPPPGPCLHRHRPAGPTAPSRPPGRRLRSPRRPPRPPPRAAGTDTSPTPGKGLPMTASTLQRAERLLHTGPGGPIGPGLAAHLGRPRPVGRPAPRRSGVGRRRSGPRSPPPGCSGGAAAASRPRPSGTGAAPGPPAPVVVVNAMEGEPASAKDRALLTRSPHLVLDGAEVAAALFGARSEIVVCVADDRDARPGRVRRAASPSASGPGGASAPWSVRRPPARYVTGEESALVAWLERGRRPPFLRVDKSVPLTWTAAGRWCTTPRRWPRWPSSPGTGRPGSAGSAPPRPRASTLVTVSGAVRTPGRGRGRARHAGRRRGRPGRARPARCPASWSAATAAPGWRPDRLATPSPPDRWPRPGPPSVSASSSPSPPRRAASPRRPGSPATWPARAPASAGRACSVCRPSPTISSCWPPGGPMPALWPGIDERSGAGGRARGLPSSRRRGPAGAQRPRRSSPTTSAAHAAGRPCAGRHAPDRAALPGRRRSPSGRCVVTAARRGACGPAGPGRSGGLRRLRLLRRAAARAGHPRRVGLSDGRRHAGRRRPGGAGHPGGGRVPPAGVPPRTEGAPTADPPGRWPAQWQTDPAGRETTAGQVRGTRRSARRRRSIR